MELSRPSCSSSNLKNAGQQRSSQDLDGEGGVRSTSKKRARCESGSAGNSPKRNPGVELLEPSKVNAEVANYEVQESLSDVETISGRSVEILCDDFSEMDSSFTHELNDVSSDISGVEDLLADFFSDEEQETLSGAKSEDSASSASSDSEDSMGDFSDDDGSRLFMHTAIRDITTLEYPNYLMGKYACRENYLTDSEEVRVRTCLENWKSGYEVRLSCEGCDINSLMLRKLINGIGNDMRLLSSITEKSTISLYVEDKQNVGCGACFLYVVATGKQKTAMVEMVQYFAPPMVREDFCLSELFNVFFHHLKTTDVVRVEIDVYSTELESILESFDFEREDEKG
ncbi:hypothetical protein [Kistimonas asteriae]|uniref:hypothetical protein n=1 Tax=Kistimonas asteriae TaxID=517724 RepID=UPI001BAA5833|nr:hypothetical protein [Kistimonas asteriae]